MTFTLVWWMIPLAIIAGLLFCTYVLPVLLLLIWAVLRLICAGVSSISNFMYGYDFDGMYNESEDEDDYDE